MIQYYIRVTFYSDFVCIKKLMNEINLNCLCRHNKGLLANLPQRTAAAAAACGVERFKLNSGATQRL